MTPQLSLFDGPAEDDSTPKTVGELTRHISSLFNANSLLQDVWVTGEISNLKRAASGHLYFSIKDNEAQLDCVMWKSAAGRLGFAPQHGAAVLAHGRIGVYEPRGNYQLYADTLQPAGAGDLHQQFERLKAKLDAEGLFDEAHKRPIPFFPRKIGIVTSPDAAGFRDVLNILERRYPVAEIIVSPTLVQGDAAPPRIIKAIDRINRRDDIDVMLVVRGGGSLEDMWCFNDEGVVRAVASTNAPTITGVGHEIDFTLVDFAADLRAPTPSAAAELATPNRDDLLYTIADFDGRLKKAIGTHLQEVSDDLKSLRRTLRLLSPQNRIDRVRQMSDDYAAKLANALQKRQAEAQQQLDLLASRLQSGSPAALLQRGYALVTRSADGTRMTHAQQAAPGTSITITLQDGDLHAQVKERELKHDD